MTKISLLKKQIEILKQLIKAAMALLLKKKKKGYEDFCLAMRKSESSNNYKIVNSLGYLGAYQFGMARLCDLGYTERKQGTTGYHNRSFIWKVPYSRKAFLGSPKLQDYIFREHVVDLVRQIHNGFKDSTIAKYTLSGMVGFAHLAGFGGLRKFVATGFDPQDVVSGVPATVYLQKFSGYNLEV